MCSVSASHMIRTLLLARDSTASPLAPACHRTLTSVPSWDRSGRDRMGVNISQSKGYTIVAELSHCPKKLSKRPSPKMPVLHSQFSGLNSRPPNALTHVRATDHSERFSRVGRPRPLVSNSTVLRFPPQFSVFHSPFSARSFMTSVIAPRITPRVTLPVSLDEVNRKMRRLYDYA